MIPLNREKLRVINRFLKNETGFEFPKRNREAQRLVATENKLFWRAPENSRYADELLAVRVGENIFSNSSRLELTQADWSYGNPGHNADKRTDAGELRTEAQILLENSGAMPLPFQALSTSGIKLDSLKVIEKGEPEKVLRDIRTPNERVIYCKLDKEGNPDLTNTRRWRDSSYSHEYQVPAKPEDIREAHFTGALLFESTDSTGRERVFLFDIDREEIKHQIFNPFITEINYSGNSINQVKLNDRESDTGNGTATAEIVSTKVIEKPKSIAEAYELLKPEAVREAELSGINVVRQGEFFFVDTKLENLDEILSDPDQVKAIAEARAVVEPNPEDYGLTRNSDRYQWNLFHITIDGNDYRPFKQLSDCKPEEFTEALLRYKEAQQVINSIKKPEKGYLRVNNNRPNEAEQSITIDKIVYVKGAVSHTGREHRIINLATWHKVYANTSQASFTITGDID